MLVLGVDASTANNHERQTRKSPVRFTTPFAKTLRNPVCRAVFASGVWTAKLNPEHHTPLTKCNKSNTIMALEVHMKKWFFGLIFLPLVTSCNLFSSLPQMAPFPEVDLQNPTENWLGNPESFPLEGSFDSTPGTKINLAWTGNDNALIGTASLDAKAKLSVLLPRPSLNLKANALDELARFETGVKLYGVFFTTKGNGDPLPVLWREGEPNFGGLTKVNLYVYAPEDVTYVKLGQMEARKNGVYVSVKFKQGWNKLYMQHDGQFDRVLLTTSHKQNFPKWKPSL